MYLQAILYPCRCRFCILDVDVDFDKLIKLNVFFFCQGEMLIRNGDVITDFVIIKRGQVSASNEFTGNSLAKTTRSGLPSRNKKSRYEQNKGHGLTENPSERQV